MPTYDYHCAQCGRFELFRPMTEANALGFCPTCGASAPRQMTAPYFNTMNANVRKAHHINERSADEPGVASRDQLERHRRHSAPLPGSDGCCGHGHAEHANGGAKRPWMIGH